MKKRLREIKNKLYYLWTCYLRFYLVCLFKAGRVFFFFNLYVFVQFEWLFLWYTTCSQKQIKSVKFAWVQSYGQKAMCNIISNIGSLCFVLICLLTHLDYTCLLCMLSTSNDHYIFEGRHIFLWNLKQCSTSEFFKE